MRSKKSLSEPIARALDILSGNINVSIPGRVEAYDAAKQRASVKPLIKRKYIDGEVEGMPVIDGVPVVFPRSGGAAVTMPVHEGDGVLLIFADRSIDRWLVQGGEVEPDDRRKHDLSDCIAVPGLVAFPDADGHDDDGVVVGYKGGARAKFHESGQVAIGTDAEELLALVSELLEALVNTTTATAIGMQPLTEAGTFAILKERLDGIKGAL